MYFMTTVIGVLSLSHGVFWALMRLVRPQIFKRGYTLAQRLGFRSSAVYFTCFVLVPLVVGVVLLTAGMSGFSVSDTVQ
jgi:ABC-type Fe3+-siderophore transport system permease subunit